MTLFSRTIFFIFFSAIFLFEGLGITDRQWALYAVYLFPFFLSLPLFFQKKTIFFPKKISLLFFLLILASIFSLFFSINIEKSFYFLIYYLSVFLIFIYVYNFKQELSAGIIFFTFFLAFVFLFDALLLSSPLSKNLSFLIPKKDYQFVYPTYQTHHPLGIFLIIPVTFLLVAVFEAGPKIYLFFFAVLFPAMFFSYFRTSYVAFIITAIFMIFKKWSEDKIDLQKLIIFTLLLTFMVLVLFSLTNYDRPVFLLSSINQFFRSHLGLNYKNFFSGRDEYWLMAIKGFSERPFFGVGLGNFYNLSLKFIQSGAVADSSSLFLDFFAETGFFGGIIFFLIFLVIFLSGENTLSQQGNLFEKMAYFAFFALLIFFQFGPGKHYSLILSFFILGALIYREEKKLNLESLFFSLSLIIVFVFYSMIMSHLYFKSGNYLLSFYRFPFQKSIFLPIIENFEKEGNDEKVDRFLKIYARFFSGEADTLNFIAQNYEKKGNFEKALYFYEQSFNWYPFQNFSQVEKIYQLKKKLMGEEEAKKFVKKILSKYYFLHYHYGRPDFENKINEFCRKESSVCHL